MNFSDLGLSPEVLKAITETGYETPTPIQEQSIPIVMQGRDLMGCAQTGTGKTASFTLPMIDMLASGRARARMPRALILEPTRELADQVAENFTVYGKYQKLSMALLIGGVSFDEQNKKIDRGVDVLIATPGRLLDHVERGKLLLSGAGILVIDEADRMLDMGFIPDVERIVKLLPPLRQTLFFSATIMPEIKKIAGRFLNNPKQVVVDPPASTAENVDQQLVVVRQEDKQDALRNILRSNGVESALIFCNRKRDVDIVARSLSNHGFNAKALHGDMQQSVRMDTLEQFRKGNIGLLVASDVAARGLDITSLPFVLNFDVPSSAEDYVHRIGRTGRAGLSGTAITLATPDDVKLVSAIERLIGNSIQVKQAPEVENMNLGSGSESERKPRGGSARRGRRSKSNGQTTASNDKLSCKPKSVSEGEGRKKQSSGKRPEKQRQEQNPTPRNGRNTAPTNLKFGVTDEVPAFLARPSRVPPE